MIHTELSLRQILAHISPSGNAERWAKAVCRIASQLTGSSLTAMYKISANTEPHTLQAKIGHTEVPQHISAESELFQAASFCGGAVLQNSKAGPFPDLLLNKNMQSGIAVLLAEEFNTAKSEASDRPKMPFTGLLIANFIAPYHYTGQTIQLFEQIRTLLSFAPQGEPGQDGQTPISQVTGGKK